MRVSPSSLGTRVPDACAPTRAAVVVVRPRTAPGRMDCCSSGGQSAGVTLLGSEPSTARAASTATGRSISINQLTADTMAARTGVACVPRACCTPHSVPTASSAPLPSRVTCRSERYVTKSILSAFKTSPMRNGNGQCPMRRSNRIKPSNLLFQRECVRTVWCIVVLQLYIVWDCARVQLFSAPSGLA